MKTEATLEPNELQSLRMSAALDNEDIRQLNSKRVMNMVDEIAENMRESKKTAKVTGYYIIGVLILFGFLIIGGIVMVAAKSGGIDNFFENYFLTDNINKRIVCSNGLDEFQFRTAEEAYYFEQVFKDQSTCHILNKGDEK
jgi:hypothetical protein